MMLGDDRGEVDGARATQPFRANLRVVGVDPVPAGERGPGSLQGLQAPWGDGAQQHRQASLDHREMRLRLAQVVQQRGLLQERARLAFEMGHCLEHVEAMPLIVHGQLEEERRKRPQDSLRTRPLLPCHAS